MMNVVIYCERMVRLLDGCHPAWRLPGSTDAVRVYRGVSRIALWVVPIQKQCICFFLIFHESKLLTYPDLYAWRLPMAWLFKVNVKPAATDPWGRWIAFQAKKLNALITLVCLGTNDLFTFISQAFCIKRVTYISPGKQLPWCIHLKLLACLWTQLVGKKKKKEEEAAEKKNSISQNI